MKFYKLIIIFHQKKLLNFTKKNENLEVNIEFKKIYSQKELQNNNKILIFLSKKIYNLDFQI